MILIASAHDPSGLARVGVILVASDQLLWQFTAEHVGDIIILAATAGDANNDGRDDIIISIAHWNETAEMMESFVDVRSGFTGALLHRLQSPESFDGFGVAAAAAGDVDGDGFDDIVVGAPFGGTQMAGYAYVFSGLDGHVIHTHRGPAPGSRFGVSVAGLGDVNGDGLADYIAGAPADETTTGVARVFSGSTGAILLTLSAASSGGMYGRNVAALGDITGDGVAEIIVTEHAIVLDEDASGTPLRQGRVHVYSGADGQALATLEGETGYVFGATLNSTSDDGDLDGFGDLIIAAASL